MSLLFLCRGNEQGQRIKVRQKRGCIKNSTLRMGTTGTIMKLADLFVKVLAAPCDNAQKRWERVWYFLKSTDEKNRKNP